jgi:hypothetical protein
MMACFRKNINFFEEIFDQKIKILAHSKNPKFAKNHLLLNLQPFWVKISQNGTT